MVSYQQTKYTLGILAEFIILNRYCFSRILIRYTEKMILILKLHELISHFRHTSSACMISDRNNKKIVDEGFGPSTSLVFQSIQYCHEIRYIHFQNYFMNWFFSLFISQAFGYHPKICSRLTSTLKIDSGLVISNYILRT